MICYIFGVSARCFSTRAKDSLVQRWITPSLFLLFFLTVSPPVCEIEHFISLMASSFLQPSNIETTLLRSQDKNKSSPFSNANLTGLWCHFFAHWNVATFIVVQVCFTPRGLLLKIWYKSILPTLLFCHRVSANLILCHALKSLKKSCLSHSVSFLHPLRFEK